LREALGKFAIKACENTASLADLPWQLIICPSLSAALVDFLTHRGSAQSQYLILNRDVDVLVFKVGAKSKPNGYHD